MTAKTPAPTYAELRTEVDKYLPILQGGWRTARIAGADIEEMRTTVFAELVRTGDHHFPREELAAIVVELLAQADI